FIDGVRLASVPLAYPIGEPGLVFLDEFDALISRTAVNDDVIEVGVALKQDRADRLLYKPALIIIGCHNRDTRPWSPVRPGRLHTWCFVRPRPARFPRWRGREVR